MSNPYASPADDPGRGQPRETLTSEEKTWALAAHVGSLLAAYVALGFLAPLVVMLVKGDSSPFVRRHAVESLNFQISLLIYAVVGAVLAFLLTLMTLGIALFVIVPVGIALALGALVVIIIATVRASNGEVYDYPLCIRFVS